MPIRWRLTLWFTAILFIILLPSGAVFYALLHYYLRQEVDNNLTVYSVRVHGSLYSAEIPNPLDYLDYVVIHSKLPPINEFASPGIYIEIRDKNGNAVVKSDNLGKQELPKSSFLIQGGFSGKVALATVTTVDGIRVRIMASPLYLKSETHLLEVGQSLGLVDATMNQAKWAITANIILALIFTAVLGNILVSKTLSPVERITRTAREIDASSDLSRRVGYRGPSDEIGKLAETFDRMIERLNRVFQSQKRFVADASHELRSPLTVIQGNIDLLKRDLSKEDREESLRAVDSESKRMSRIIIDLLLLAEIESDKTQYQEDVSLKEIVQDEFRRAKTLAGSRQVFISSLDDLSVKGDSYRLRQLLSNLADNAVKYTPDGGTITLSLLRDGDFARLDVSDTGTGISAEQLPHLFQRFYRIDKSRSRSGGGTGLGLAIVKEIAEQHHGKVAVVSELGKGSTFTVWLKL